MTPSKIFLLADVLCFFYLAVLIMLQRKKARSLYAKRERVHLIYSHSIVAGGLEVISYTTRLTLLTSFTMRVEIFSSTSHGMRAQSAVMPSIDVTARMPTVYFNRVNYYSIIALFSYINCSG
ncbi:hypothetical protein SAMN05421868_1525 [Paenibacillus naphthalenovorans]|nr:hypothetical protein SAMN05421868_1525 [Paenibacillus naphthalenovorans]